MNDDEYIYFNARPVRWWNGFTEWVARLKGAPHPFPLTLTDDDLP